MHISNDRYFHERERHDLALRMIHHEARTCTIRSCTGLTDDRIRKLYRTYAEHRRATPVRRHRGKSPRRTAFFTRSTPALFESSMLASVFASFGLLRASPAGTSQAAVLEFGQQFCDAYETHRQLLREATISFEHAWFLLKLLQGGGHLRIARCRRCFGRFLHERFAVKRPACPACKLKEGRAPRRLTASNRPRIRRSAGGTPAKKDRHGDAEITG